MASRAPEGCPQEARQAKAAEKAQKAAQPRTPEQLRQDELIRSWVEDNPISEPLSEASWAPTGKVDSCGCGTWTRPGAGYGDKFATLHNAGCSQNDVDQLLLQLWTTDNSNVVAQFALDHDIRRMNTLQVFAAVFYDSGIGTLMRHEGLFAPRGAGAFMVLDEDDAEAQEKADDLVERGAGQRIGNLPHLLYKAPVVAPEPLPAMVQDALADTKGDAPLAVFTADAAAPIVTCSAEEAWSASGKFSAPHLRVLDYWNGAGFLTDDNGTWSITRKQLEEPLTGEVTEHQLQAAISVLETTGDLRQFFPALVKSPRQGRGFRAFGEIRREIGL